MSSIHKTLAALSFVTLTASGALGQSAAGMFTEGLIVGDERDRWEELVDLNSDGVLDVLGWYWEDSNFSSIRANATLLDGEGRIVSMSTVTSPTLGSAPDDYATGVGDFEDTGRIQMVVLFGSSVARFEADELGQLSYVDAFSPIYHPNATYPYRAVAVADFTGDGVDDFVLCTDYRMELWTAASGTPQYLGMRTWTSGWKSRISIEVAEMTGDGKPDIVAVQHHYTLTDAAELAVYPIANGSFGTPSVFPFSVNGIKHLAAGDVDGDLDDDAVVFVDGPSNSCALLRQEEAGVFTFEPFGPGGPATDLADVDGDGYLDGVCCSGGGGGPSIVKNTTPSTFMVCLNDGTGGFDNAQAFGGLGADHIAGVMDFDGDGDMDLLAGRAVLVNTSDTGQAYCVANPNSTGVPAVLSASGSASLARNDLTLNASSLPPNKFAIAFYGYQRGYTPFHNGMRCVSGNVYRLKQAGTSNASGALSIPVDLTKHPGSQILLGDVLPFQVWYRDAASSNLTQGLQILFHP
jgi:hypothetical protein